MYVCKLRVSCPSLANLKPRMAQHVRVNAELEAASFAQSSDHLAKANRAERCAALANEHKRRFRALAL
jgi:hypothetical protein